MWGTGSNEDLETLLRSSATIALVPAAGLTMLFIVFGRPMLVAGFGDFYGGANTVLVLLSLGYLITTASGSSALLLVLTGRQRSLVIATLWTAPVSLILIFVCGYTLGYLGVAAATAVAMGAMHAIYALTAMRTTGVNTFATLAPAQVIRIRDSLRRATADMREDRDAPPGTDRMGPGTH